MITIHDLNEQHQESEPCRLCGAYHATRMGSPMYCERCSLELARMAEHDRRVAFEANRQAINKVYEEWQTAVAKAWDSLARYKFEMFGYWASKSVSYGQLIEKLGGKKPESPFRSLVHAARAGIEDGSAVPA